MGKTYSKLIFVGDILLKKKDSLILNNNLKKVIRGGDIVSCNFEGPILPQKAIRSIKAGPNIHQKDSSIEELSRAGFNLFNLSNNHIMDYGEGGLNETTKKMKGIDYLGAGKTFENTYSLKIKKLGKTRIGFLAFSEWDSGAFDKETENFGFAWINHPKTNEIIKDSRKKCDILIVQAHAGEECIQLPQPCWRKRYKEIIDIGADMVIGHHPHIGQPIEKYKGKFIIYSLGNFYFKSLSNPKKVENYILQLTLKGSCVENLKIIPILQVGNLIMIKESNKFKSFVYNYFKKNSEDKYTKDYLKIEKTLWENRYKIYFTEFKTIRFIKNFIKYIVGKPYSSKDTIMKHLERKESHKEIIKKFI